MYKVEPANSSSESGGVSSLDPTPSAKTLNSVASRVSARHKMKKALIKQNTFLVVKEL